MANFYPEKSFRSIVWQDSLLKDTGLILIGVALLGVAAQIIIPWHPIPLTFQSAAVVLLGLVYGSRLGAITVLSYLVAGGLGLPVFAGLSSGWVVFSGESIGYLLGFIPAAYFGGLLAERGWAGSILTTFIASLLSASIIFFTGLLVLSQFIGFQQAIWVGLMPFILTEPLKLLAIALVVPRCWKKA